MTMAVFSSMPNPRVQPGLQQGRHQPSEPAALQEVLVDQAVGEEAEARARG